MFCSLDSVYPPIVLIKIYDQPFIFLWKYIITENKILLAIKLFAHTSQIQTNQIHVLWSGTFCEPVWPSGKALGW